MELRPPRNLDEIRKLFGDERPYLTDQGHLRAIEWESAILARIQLPAPLLYGSSGLGERVGSLRCHKLIAPILSDALAEIHGAGNWPLLRSYDGCYNFRPVRVGAKLSTHSWGIALDLNASTNQRGTPGDMPSEIIGPFVRRGWSWGGSISAGLYVGTERPDVSRALPNTPWGPDWHTSDPMHFQYCSKEY